MTRVLVPVDGSECALRAVDLVAKRRLHYADPEQMEIHLVNVQPPLSHDVTRFFSHEETLAFLREEGEKYLQPARDLLDATGAKYTCHIDVGHIAETICGLAEKLSCDQIVMGSHGRGALLKMLMGSVTMKVLHLSQVPVLLVK